MTRTTITIAVALFCGAMGCSALKEIHAPASAEPVAVRSAKPDAKPTLPPPPSSPTEPAGLWKTEPIEVGSCGGLGPCGECCVLKDCDAGWLSWPKADDGAIGTFFALSWQDYKHFYSAENLACLGLGVGVAGVMANTPIDEEFHGWYHKALSSPDWDDAANGVKFLGDHFVMVPLYVGVMWLGSKYPDNEFCSTAGQWACRTSRALMVGAPAVGVLQYGLGAGRPDADDSLWRPFNDKNSVAGHGFLGAVPFLAAASMTENRLCKGGLVAASWAVNWSRIQTNSHYLSQTVLGWWIAYLAVQSVGATERERQAIRVIPSATPDGPCVNVLIEY